MGLLLAELAVTALFVGLGVLFSKGKGAFLIAGYNTMSKEKKARYDKNALCRFMGKFMFALAACWVPVAPGDRAGTGVAVRGGHRRLPPGHRGRTDLRQHRTPVPDRPEGIR